ncbi:NitT/TauT family transport system permease protein [Paenibacillus sp. 1_12]|uniref:ABC transporter permease n=1 Tax=Paenibacillus sp. 1_12 TaxID=1566278 RepID=UPI0008EB1E60|nr:ABC transporter permease [Paenibacillus sp. 1_12]SFL84748.1 NitT/TauT family transport system permease protein [Paenibacillus sp. 1_12]
MKDEAAKQIGAIAQAGHTAQLAEKEHGRFRKNARRITWIVRLSQLLILVVFMIWWELAGRLQWIDPLLFSYPSRIAALLYSKAIDGSLLIHLEVTIWETIVGFVLGTLFGTAAAALIWWSPFLSRVLDPYIVVLNSLPKVALGPLFIVAFGAGQFAIIATTLSLTVIITLLVVSNSFKEVDPNYSKVIRIFGGTRGHIFQKVILPASYPTILSTLKVNVGLSWVGVIVGEFLVSKEGLGYLIIYGFQVFNFTLVIGSVILIAIAAAVMYQGVAFLERKLMGKR